MKLVDNISLRLRKSLRKPKNVSIKVSFIYHLLAKSWVSKLGHNNQNGGSVGVYNSKNVEYEPFFNHKPFNIIE